MKQTTIRSALLLLTMLVCGVAGADALPPQANKLVERFASNPNAFDRVDPWCDDHRVGQACSIPGSAFNGGGSGKCERVVNRAEYRFIDLRCALSPAPQIDRRLPSGPRQLDSDMCADLAPDEANKDIMRQMGMTCEEPPMTSDRFCQDRKSGEACTVEITVGGAVEQATGVCRQEIETSSTYYRGQRSLRRPVMLCAPANKRADAPLKPVSAWRKLFQ